MIVKHLALDLGLVASAVLFGTAAVMPVESDPPTPVDALIVLGGDADDCPRARTALALATQGYANALVISEPPVKPGHNSCLAYARHALARFARQGDTPPDLIAMTRARSTYAEAIETRALVSAYGWRSVMIVTSPQHTYRAALTFRSLLPIPIGVRASDEAALGAPLLSYVEALKLLYYGLRYGITPWSVTLRD